MHIHHNGHSHRLHSIVEETQIISMFINPFSSPSVKKSCLQNNPIHAFSVEFSSNQKQFFRQSNAERLNEIGWKLAVTFTKGRICRNTIFSGVRRVCFGQLHFDGMPEVLSYFWNAWRKIRVGLTRGALRAKCSPTYWKHIGASIDRHRTG